MIHITPINDTQEHTEETTCLCHPTVLWKDEATGEWYSEPIVVHHAFDCREAVEGAEEILKAD